MAIDVEPVAEVIDHMVATLKDAIWSLECYADKMRNDKNIYYSGDVANILSNLPQNLRVDLLIDRSLSQQAKGISND